MKLLNAMLLSLFLLASTSCLSQVASAQNLQTINITRRGSQQSSKGQPRVLLARFALSPFSMRTIRHDPPAGG